MTRTRRWIQGSIAAACVAFSACAPQSVIASGAQGPDSADRVSDALAAKGVSCDVDGAYARCVVNGIKMSLTVTLATTGRQLWMVVPYAQDACAQPAYHARIQKFNEGYFLVVAACVDKSTLMLSHHTQLFRAGLGKEELQKIVEYWVSMAVGAAANAGLIGTDEEAAPEAPTGSKA